MIRMKVTKIKRIKGWKYVKSYVDFNGATHKIYECPECSSPTENRTPYCAHCGKRINRKEK